MIFKATITETLVRNGEAKQILKGSTYMPAVNESDAYRRFCSREAGRILDGIDNAQIRKIKIDYPAIIKVEYLNGDRIMILLSEVEKDQF